MASGVKRIFNLSSISLAETISQKYPNSNTLAVGLLICMPRDTVCDVYMLKKKGTFYIEKAFELPLKTVLKNVGPCHAPAHDGWLKEH
jgi:hypothetical protein